MEGPSSWTLDPFELLGLDHARCSSDVARAAFRDLALLVHPDKGGSATDMRVLTSAHRYVQKCLVDGDGSNMDRMAKMSFSEFFEKEDDGSDFNRELGRPDAGATPAFDLAEFNRIYEASNPHAIYVGPAKDDPTTGEVVKMAAGTGGAGEGYGDGMLPRMELEEALALASDPESVDRHDLPPPPPLARNQITLHREFLCTIPSIVPEHGPTTIRFNDYADAFREGAVLPPPPAPPPGGDPPVDELLKRMLEARALPLDDAGPPPPPLNAGRGPSPA
jgi:hypothetical protein